jgi:hypothetical protein
MNARTVAVVIGGTSVALCCALVTPAGATEFNANGTLVDKVTGVQSSWQASFSSWLTTLQGVVTVTGPRGETTQAEVVGSLTPDWVQFVSTTSSGWQGTFLGNMDGATMRGVATGPTGPASWEGVWVVAPGVRRPEVAPEEFVGAETE